MRVLHVSTGVLERASGSTEAILETCRSVVDCGVDLELLVGYGEPVDGMPFPIRGHRVWKWPPRMGAGCPGCMDRAIKY